MTPDVNQYHDRLDVRTDLTTADVLALFGRALTYVSGVRQLLAARLSLTVVIFVLGLPLPWLLKIIVDHGVMQQPIEPDLLYPTFMQPWLAVMAGAAPLDVTLYTLLALGAAFLLVGYSGNTLLEANLAEGADVATQSENKVSAGMSPAHGLIGLLDLQIAIRFSQRITHAVRSELFARMTALPSTTLSVQRPGDGLFRVMHDAPAIAGLCHALIVSPFGMVVSVGLNLAVLTAVYASTAPALVWIGFGAVALTLLATSPLAGWMRRVSQSSRASGSATANDLEEGLRNVAAVQSLGGSETERTRFREASSESFARSWMLSFVRQVVLWVSDNIHLVFQTVGFYVIFTGIIRGELTLGDTPVILRMYSLLYETSMQFGQVWIDQQDNAAAARRVMFMLDQPAETDDGPELRLDDERAGLALRDVGFVYPDGRRVLEGVTLDAAPGDLIAIAGPTGAGKTTLASMIPAFLTPTEGDVLIDGVNLRTVNPRSVRAQVAYVFQEHHLLTGSVADNLRIAHPHADDSDLWNALERAGAADFVRDLPGGLDGRIGRGGGTLSTGQKQRLSIARALVRNAPFLILDEPTAALDQATEAALMASLSARDSAGDRQPTVIVIAHRLSTLRRATRILYLEAGRIVESGTHDALISADGPYSRMVSASN